MKRTRVATTLVPLLAVFILTWTVSGPTVWGDSLHSTKLESAQLLTNPDMEQVFITYPSDCLWEPCQVASGWSRFGDVALRPCWMDARVFANVVMDTDWVEKIKGATSQVVFSAEPYAAGIYQRVDVGEGLPYGFTAAMMTIYESSANPPEDGLMFKEVGIDPTGGIDPDGDSVVWSEPDDRDKAWALDSRIASFATSGSMTVFIRVRSPYRTDKPWPNLNQSFLDGALLAETATAWISTPEVSLDDTFVVEWGAEASSGGELWAYDVQWQDLADGEWRDWIQEDLPEKSLDSVAVFQGDRGHSYRFRARAWQYYEDAGNYLYSPWSETAQATTVAAARLVGKVRGNGPYSFGWTSISMPGTEFETMSRPDGSYAMWTEPMEVGHEVQISNLPWLSPAPVYGVTFGVTETVVLDWSLRPPDDAVENGGFEAGMAGWTTVSEPGATPAAVGEPVHTGYGAVMLGGEAEVSGGTAYRSGIRQTKSLTRSWNPNLSFWYLPETVDSDDQFTVSLTVVGDSVVSEQLDRGGPETPVTPQSLLFTPSLDAAGWQHQWYSLGTGDAYFTGTVTIELEVWNDGDESAMTVYLDEVSLGRTPGGPLRVFFPLVSRYRLDAGR